jgi:hypothetical protein
MPGHITSNLCSCIRWDLWVKLYVLVHLGREISTQYFSCSIGPGADPTNSMLDTLHRTFVFASDEIYGPRSTLWWVRGAKHRCNIFHSRLGQARIPQKRARTCYTKLMFLCSDTVKERNVNALFFMLGWAGCYFHKMHVGTHYVELVFLHSLGSAGNVLCSSVSVA